MRARQVLTRLPIGVLGSAALPQAIRIGKEDPDRGSEQEGNYSGIQAEV
jgi:hypothetical protein